MFKNPPLKKNFAMPNGFYPKNARSNRRDSYLSRGRQARNAKLAANRKINKPVLRKLRKPRVVTKTARNQSAIVTLSRQVKSLMARTKGEYQWTKHEFDLGPLPTVGLGRYSLCSLDSACCFLVSDFTKGFISHGYVQNTGPNTGVPELLPYAPPGAAATPGTPMGRWMPVNNDGSGLLTQFDWRKKHSQEVADTSLYWPIKSYFRFQVDFTVPPNVTHVPVFFRTTIIKLKKNFNNSTVKDFTMPATLGTFKHCCVGNATGVWRNNFNPDIHHVLADKVVRVTNYNLQANPSNGQIYSKSWSMPYMHRDQAIRIDAAEGSSEAGNVNLSIPLHQHIWMVITTSATKDIIEQWRMHMRVARTISWRDEEGTTGA